MNRMSCINAPFNQLVKQFTHSISVRNVNNKAFAASRQSKTLSKLLTGKVKNKKQWRSDNDTPKLPSIASLADPVPQGKSSHRRVNVLNKLFMRHITDYMATDNQFSGYGLEISKVNITIDFRLVNVYWIARGDENDAHLESLLSKAAGPIRHNLSQLRLMGEVPTIKFVKDKTYAKGVEVEALLKRADFGDDFTPFTASQLVRNDLSCATESDTVLPEMTHNILGLNQGAIMSRIKTNMSKAKQAWEKYESPITSALEEKYAFSGEEKKDAIIKLKEEEFQAFLHQRRVRKFRERKARAANTEDDDFDEDEANQFEEPDTFIDGADVDRNQEKL